MLQNSAAAQSDGCAQLYANQAKTAKLCADGYRSDGWLMEKPVNCAGAIICSILHSYKATCWEVLVVLSPKHCNTDTLCAAYADVLIRYAVPHSACTVAKQQQCMCDKAYPNVKL